MSVDERQIRLRSRATYASVVVSVVLIAIKLVAWLATGSVALLSSLVDSSLDVVAAVVNLFAVRHALEPADREHRFGHGKAEPLAALGQAAFLAGGALLLVLEAVNRMVSPAPIGRTGLGIAVMFVSIAIDGALVLYQRYVVARTKSLAIGADELHFRSDLFVNAAVLAALLLDRFAQTPVLDPLLGGAIGLWIIYGSVRLLRLSLNQLMDHELPDRERARIRQIVESESDVAALHDLKTRAAGPVAFIQLHLEMDGSMRLSRAHEISDEVEAKLREAYPNAEIIIHQDPAGLEEPRQAFAARTKASG
ncbi:MAG: cation diffusion facilitator family transporter [Alphaproteobacteria bacterium]|nr:cation diffusion facilitator family transporter [Alphaproteobacteria bacterium]MBV9551708.1 cation diffusion facilitator family transporter [Alphaproteobacteria bacterium]